MQLPLYRLMATGAVEVFHCSIFTQMPRLSRSSGLQLVLFGAMAAAEQRENFAAHATRQDAAEWSAGHAAVEN
jgi:hypothetical protein